LTGLSARIVLSDPKPTPRSRTLDGSPWRTSSVVAVPSLRKSPFVGADSSAPSRKRTWYEARDGEKTPT